VRALIFRNISLPAAAVLSLALSCPTYALQTLVDTGQPTGQSGSGLFGFTGRFIQHLAARVTFQTAVNVQSVALWANGGGNMTASLYADGPVPGGTALFTAQTSNFSFGSERWVTLSGLGWNGVASGSYWLAFEPLPTSAAGFDGGAREGAPTPLPGYAFSTEQPIVGTWLRQDSLGLGIRVIGEVASSAIPEPDSWAMLIGGFGLIGAVKRRRRHTGKATA
jgi:hypothetical protein